MEVSEDTRLAFGPSSVSAKPMPPIVISTTSTIITTNSTSSTKSTGPSAVIGKQVESLPRARGLSNLGNTCFFNACMQCLGQTPFLTTIFKEEVVHLPGGEYRPDDAEGKPTGDPIQMPPIKIEYTAHVDEMLQSFQETMTQLQTSGGVLNPSEFFRRFTKQHPQFAGGDQHDSHELLRHLLDAVLVSENRIYQNQILAANFNGRRFKSLTPDEVKKYTWYANQSKHRFLIRRVFQGSLESTLRCEECGNTSPNNEKFLDISLPVWQGPEATIGKKGKGSSPDRLVPLNKKQLRKEKRAAATKSDHHGGGGGEVGTEAGVELGAKGDFNSKSSTTDISDAESADDLLDISAGEPTFVKHENEPEPDSQDFIETFGLFTLSPQYREEFLRRHALLSSDEHCRTIGAPYISLPGECSVGTCLNAFVATELLSGNNKVTCDACTRRLNGPDPKAKSVLTNATKQFLVSSLPAVLILHLKRFQMGLRHSFMKLSTEVSFPLVLDMGPFCRATPQTAKEYRTVRPDQKHILYSLYGVVEHSGTMHTGHYIAYVKVRPTVKAGDPRWQFVSKLYNESREAPLPNGTPPSPPQNGFNENGDSSESGLDDSNDNDGQNNNPSGDPSVDGVKPPPGQWYKISDSRVMETTAANVLKAQAYLLFYERIF